LQAPQEAGAEEPFRKNAKEEKGGGGGGKGDCAKFNTSRETGKRGKECLSRGRKGTGDGGGGPFPRSLVRKG